MDRVGVNGSIFISPFSMYRYDASYAVEVQRAHPHRFAIVKPVDPDDPAVDDVVADWKRTPGAVGIRIMLTKEAKRDPNDPGLDRIGQAAIKHDLPVNILFWDGTSRKWPQWVSQPASTNTDEVKPISVMFVLFRLD